MMFQVFAKPLRDFEETHVDVYIANHGRLTFSKTEWESFKKVLGAGAVDVLSQDIQVILKEQ